MILDFPGYHTILQSLTAGLIPEAVFSAQAVYEEIEDGHVLVSLDGKLDRATTKTLSALGVKKRRVSAKTLTRTASCWMEMLPLADAQPRATDKAAVLFDIEAGDPLSEVVSEMLRLGNDRQAFRVLGEDEDARVLLRVIGPPYYSLLRALERGLAGTHGHAESNGKPLAAFVEQAPRVWIELGATHPLIGQLKPPAGRLLLIRRQGPWQLIPEAPFQDIYDSLDFTLSDQPVELADSQLASKMQVPLRLVRGGSGDIAELWVLDGSGSDQLDEFVRTSDERLVGRLSFAVAAREDGSGETIIIRLRPSREAPPVLVLDGLTCEPYLKLPNLFVPSGHRIHPPLRRDVVKNLLAESASQITWLEPAEDDDGSGAFVPRRVADVAFRPLEDWVDYVLDREHEPLTAWMQSSRFDFEAFVCPDERSDRKPKKKAERDQRTRPERSSDSRKSRETGTADAGGGRDARSEKPKRAKRARRKTSSTRQAPKELEKQLRTLEKAFLELEEPLDSPEREPLWTDLARTNAALKLNTEAGICWVHTFWEQHTLDPDQTDEWFEVESRLWTDRDGLLNEPEVEATLDRLLAVGNPSPLEMNTLASWLVLEAADGGASPVIAKRLGRLQHYLERFEPILPIRTAWLAWCAYLKFSHGDVLALARARDRMLERLFQHGLMPDRDVPSFLRARGMQSGDRFRAVRDQIVDLRETAKKWSQKHRKAAGKTAAATTDQYIDLVFAFALARLGETTAGQELLTEVTETLGETDAIHAWSVAAYGFRIRQALEGRTGSEPLPDEVMQQLDAMGRLDRYKLDRLRQHSNILEPHEKIDPFRRWHQRFTDDLSRELATLADTRDREELTQHMTRLLGEITDPAQRRRVITTALEVGPRLGEVVAREILEEAFGLLDSGESDTVLEQALLLEGGLFLAGHYDQTEAVSSFIDRLHSLLESQEDADTETIQTLQTLLMQSFRGMRKLGMRDNIARLLDQMATLVRSAEGKLSGSRKSADTDRASLLETMLQVASGWFFFGQNESAWPVLDQVRDILFEKDKERTLPAVAQKKLACAYASSLGQAPVEEAIPRLAELFRKLKGISDSFTTNTHFSLSHLDLIEAVLLAMVSDDFTMNEAGRRWLDDDEFLIRRRIHRDVRDAMKQEA